MLRRWSRRSVPPFAKNEGCRFFAAIFTDVWPSFAKYRQSCQEFFKYAQYLLRNGTLIKISEILRKNLKKWNVPGNLAKFYQKNASFLEL